MVKYHFLNVDNENKQDDKNQNLQKKQKTNQKKSSKLVAIFIIVFCLGLSVLLANLVSNLLGNKSFSVSAKNTSKIYALSFGRYATSKLASEKANEVISSNGAGYVYVDNGVYHVIASAYSSENDAINVQNKLGQQNINAEIIEIPVNYTKINTTNFSDEEIEIVNNAQKIFFETFEKLYDISISLDNGVIDEVQARVKISSIKAEVEALKSNYDAFITKKAVTDVLKLKLNLFYLNESLSDLLSLASDLTSKIKYTYIYVTQIC